MRTAVGIMESSHIRVCRVADNMRNVAVTEGDKVEAQIKFGWEVDAYPVNEIAEYVNAVSKREILTLLWKNIIINMTFFLRKRPGRIQASCSSTSRN